MSQSPEATCDLLLSGGQVVTVDEERRVYPDGAVAVVGERIADVGPTERLRLRWRPRRTVDCTGRVVLPGLVDTHNHLFQTLARGLGEGLSIWPWLREFMWPYSLAMESEDARTAVALGSVEALRSGTTAVLDHHYAPTDPDTVHTVVETIETTGLRGVVARGVLGDRGAVAEARGLPEALHRYSNAEELEITRECVRKHPRGSRIEVWPGPLNLCYLDQELVRECVQLAADADVGWHTHCSEGRKDPASYLDAYGVRPVEWLGQQGLLDRRASLAHAVWLDEAEVTRAGQAGANIACNPVSNGYLASGVPPLRELLDAGAVVGLGTDGSACGHRQDLFECMKQTILAQRQDSLDPTVLRCEDALELATRGGAAHLGLPAGSLAPGLFADLIVVNLDRPHLTPTHRAVASLVHATRGSDVDLTMVNGEVVYEDGRCLRVDEQALLTEARERAELLVRRADFGALRTAWYR